MRARLHIKVFACHYIHSDMDSACSVCLSTPMLRVRRAVGPVCWTGHLLMVCVQGRPCSGRWCSVRRGARQSSTDTSGGVRLCDLCRDILPGAQPYYSGLVIVCSCQFHCFQIHHNTKYKVTSHIVVLCRCPSTLGGTRPRVKLPQSSPSWTRTRCSCKARPCWITLAWSSITATSRTD
jgi:hypothetical protein